MKRRWFAVVCLAWGFLFALSAAAYGQDPDVGERRAQLVRRAEAPRADQLALTALFKPDSPIGKGPTLPAASMQEVLEQSDGLFRLWPATH